MAYHVEIDCFYEKAGLCGLPEAAVETVENQSRPSIVPGGRRICAISTDPNLTGYFADECVQLCKARRSRSPESEAMRSGAQMLRMTPDLFGILERLSEDSQERIKSDFAQDDFDSPKRTPLPNWLLDGFK